jgi:hypothetical protein
MKRLVALAAVVPFLAACGGSSELSSRAASSDCHASDMAVRRVGMAAGMFHYALVFAIVNKGTSSCRLSGYPQLTPERYPFRIPLRIHEDTMWPWYRSPKWGHPVNAVSVPPGGRADLAIGWVGNPDASATRLRYCSRLKPTTFKLVLPHASRPLAGALIRVGFCPTAYVGSNLYVSPILAAPLSS